MTSVAFVIAGPTASGKSALALRLAAMTGGAIVNVDSMQVYRDLAVLTARPGAEEEAAAPHRLFGHVDGATNHSVGRYLEEARSVLATLDAAGTTPILVGGSGLYLKALTEGLSDLPAVPAAVRERVRADAADLTSTALHAELASRDPVSAAGLRPSDRSRILRALEFTVATGGSIAAARGERRPGPLGGHALVALFLAPDRTELRERIDRRFDLMVERGALEEVSALARRGLDPALPVMRAHGVPHLLRHLAGDLSLADAVERGKADTRAYAKRQFTWFRHQMTGFAAVPPDQAWPVLEEAWCGLRAGS